jgi:magnesium-transporting ATPase (P-type)
LTGDKKETAKCIAIKTALATSLFSFYDYDRELEIFKRDIFNDQIRPTKKQRLNQTFAESSNDIDGSSPTDRDLDNYRVEKFLDHIKDEADRNQNLQGRTLIITGTDIEGIYRAGQEKSFIRQAVLFKSTVVCRCSPQQKSDITALLRNEMKKIICAIGDGGNDVAMIQQANVGLGIEGKEGLQAALASDFSLKQFKDLKPLLYWHGRKSFLGIS